jgi:hypothetical protein
LACREFRAEGPGETHVYEREPCGLFRGVNRGREESRKLMSGALEIEVRLQWARIMKVEPI